MRSNFPGYDSLSEEDLNELWEKAVLVLDTNVLLDFYRVSPETQSDLLRLVRYYAEHERLWIPYQVALEYHANLYEVIFQQIKKYDDTLKLLAQFFNSITQKRNHPFLTDNYIRRIRNLMKDLECYFESQKKKLKDSVGESSLKDDIADIFDGHVGKGFTDQQLVEIYAQGKNRYLSNIPPGYEDKKKGEPEKYNDLVVWKEVLEYATEQQMPVFFVSSDTKKDWYLIQHGETICPQPALIKEFQQETNQTILMFTLERFLSLAKERNVVNIQDDSIKEVKVQDRKDNGVIKTFSYFSDLKFDDDDLIKMCESLKEVSMRKLKKYEHQPMIDSEEIGSTSSNLAESIIGAQDSGLKKS